MNLQAIADHADVKAARSLIHRADRETLEEQTRIAAIPAPSGQEAERAAHLRKRFEELQLSAIESDEVGNVIGFLGGSPGPESGATPVIVAAHLDTIFPPGTAMTRRVVGTRIYTPGITDNARGLAAMLTIARALSQTGIETRHPIAFVATVGEEGLGDLRGVKHLFRDGSIFRRAAAFISIDGAGLTRIVSRAIGASRVRATISGVGGHSWGDRGQANPAHALGLAIGRLAKLRPRGDKPFAVTVGRLGGGTSVNAIPSEAWLELDLRGEEASTLAKLARQAREALELSVREERENSGRGAPLRLGIEQIGSRPCGAVAPQDPLLAAAVAATRLLGGAPELTASSTDANVPISLGISAIALGAGGRTGGIHTADEWFENHGGARGIERALITTLAVAGVHGADQL